MIRPGTSVNSPASTSAPAKIDIIVILWVRTRWPRAASTPTTNMIGVNTEGLDQKIRKTLPAYMTMGESGMGGMGDMGGDF